MPSGYTDFNLISTQGGTEITGIVRVHYSYVQNPATNQSTITVTGFQYMSKAVPNSSFSVAGRISVATLNIDFTGQNFSVRNLNEWYSFGDNKTGDSCVVTHQSDGTGSFTIHIQANPSYHPSDVTNFYITCAGLAAGNGKNNVSNTITLNRIVKQFSLSISAGNNVAVAVNRISSPLQGASQGYLSDGSIIYDEDVISIVYSVNEGNTLSLATLNGDSFNSGEIHTVSTAVFIVVSATLNQYSITRTVSEGLTLIINRTASPYGGGSTGILAGNTVYYGDELELVIQANDGYSIESMSINNIPFQDSPHIVTISESIVIVLVSGVLGFVYIDSGATIEKYMIFIDSGAEYEQYRAMIDTGSAIVPY